MLVTWPAARSPTEFLVGARGGDVVKHAWNLWWMRAEAAGGTPGLRTTLVNFPDGVGLFPIEPLHGLAALLLPLDPVTLANVLVVVEMAVLGYVSCALGRRVAGCGIAGLAAGAIAQLGSYTAFIVHVGVGELRELWCVPLGLLLVERLRSRPSVLGWAGMGLYVAATTAVCLYYGLFLCVALAVVVLTSFPRDRATVLGMGTCALACLLAVAPLVVSFDGAWGGGGAVDATAQDLAWQRLPSEADAASTLSLSELVRANAFDASERGYAYESGRYVGVLLLLLAAVAVVGAPRRALPWATMLVVPTVMALGATTTVAGHAIPLPYLMMERVLDAVATPLNFPARFLALSWIALSVLGALAVARWPAAWGLIALGLLDVARADGIPWPRDTVEVPDLTPLPAPDGAFADLTFALGPDGPVGQAFDATERRAVIGAQMYFARPIQLAPIDRVEMWADDGYRWTSALPLVLGIRAGVPTRDDAEETAALLRAQGFHAVVFTHACSAHDGLRSANRARDARTVTGARHAVWADLLDRVYGPRGIGRCGQVWTLPEESVPPDVLAAWMRAHSDRIAMLAARSSAARERAR